MNQIDPPVTGNEIAGALQILYPDTFERIVAVLKGTKRLALIPVEEAPEQQELDLE